MSPPTDSPPHSGPFSYYHNKYVISPSHVGPGNSIQELRKHFLLFVSGGGMSCLECDISSTFSNCITTPGEDWAKTKHLCMRDRASRAGDGNILVKTRTWVHVRRRLETGDQRVFKVISIYPSLKQTRLEMDWLYPVREKCWDKKWRNWDIYFSF